MVSRKYVVTGGGGFVGRALCLALQRRGHEVVGVGRGSYPELESRGVTFVRADISRESGAIEQAAAGADAVFHAAAKVDMWGRFAEYFASNVVATRNVISACRKEGVGKLIFTSSPSVIADGTDLINVDEDHPYPAKYAAYYPQTKAAAEREVLAAHGQGGLSTVSLRPHLVFGPGDKHLVPTILERAKAGRLVQIGAGQNMVDFTYIDDCVQAHLCALQALADNRAVGGRAYFISQGDPVRLWWWIGEILKHAHLPEVRRRLPRAAALALASVMETACRALPSYPQPPLTRFLVSEMSTHHYFNINRARQDLGYQPTCTVAEALRSTFS